MHMNVKYQGAGVEVLGGKAIPCDATSPKGTCWYAGCSNSYSTPC